MLSTFKSFGLFQHSLREVWLVNKNLAAQNMAWQTQTRSNKDGINQYDVKHVRKKLSLNKHEIVCELTRSWLKRSKDGHPMWATKGRRIEGAKESCRKKRAIMEVIVIDWHLSSGYVPSRPHSHSTSLTYTPLIITPPHSQYLWCPCDIDQKLTIFCILGH